MSTTSSAAAQIRSRVPRLAEAAVERARLTVVPARRVRAARVPFVTLVTVLLLGGVVGLLLFNTQMQQASFAATALEKQAGDLAARQQTLTMEIERLRDPQTIAQRATRLGMVVPAAPAFLDLDSGAVEGDPVPAGPEGRLPINPGPPAMPAVLNPAPQVVTVEAPPEGVLPEERGNGGRNADGGRNSGDTARGDGRGGDGGGRNTQESQQSQGSRQNQQQDQRNRR
jgi:cell division protein FtsB